MDEKRLLERIERLEAEITNKNESKVKVYFNKAISKTNAIVGILIAFVVTGVVLYAAQINFTDGTVISATEVNSNFTELHTDLSNHDTRLTTIETNQWTCPNNTQKDYGVCYVAQTSYSYTFAQSAVACKNLGMKLCNLSDLHQIQANGVEYCSWTWIADYEDSTNGKMAYPMVTSKTGCGGVGINVTSMSKANSFGYICCR